MLYAPLDTESIENCYLVFDPSVSVVALPASIRSQHRCKQHDPVAGELIP